MVAPDIPYHSTKFHPCPPSQSKVILTHVNSTYTPSWPKNIPLETPALATTSTPPNIHVYKTLPKIFIINVEILI